jgi:thiamine-phosphate pyrophosphorylase
MPCRQTPAAAIPRLWLMTDERQGDGLWRALDRLPRGSGLIFRHYGLAPAERRLLFERVRRVARRRRLVLVLAGSPRLAIAWRADGVHGRSPHRPARPLVRTAPAHGAVELVKARRAGASLIFLSPVFATRSHPEGRPLGPVRFGILAQGRGRIAALGGMNVRRGRRLTRLGSYGWAGIDAFG